MLQWRRLEKDIPYVVINISLEGQLFYKDQNNDGKVRKMESLIADLISVKLYGYRTRIQQF